MKTLFVLVGIQGAGKSTVLEALVNKGFTILKPSTTRPPRHPSDNEYHFETDQTWGNEPMLGKYKDLMLNMECE